MGNATRIRSLRDSQPVSRMARSNQMDGGRQAEGGVTADHTLRSGSVRCGAGRRRSRCSPFGGRSGSVWQLIGERNFCVAQGQEMAWLHLLAMANGSLVCVRACIHVVARRGKTCRHVRVTQCLDILFTIVLCALTYVKAKGDKEA